MDLNKTLENLYWEELGKEGITKEDVEIVMLEIGFSPVTPFKGADPCEVIETIGEKYIVMCKDMTPMTVTPEQLKVMRYRYLQYDPGRIAQRNAINNFFKK